MAQITRMTPPLPGKPGLIDIKTYNQLKGFLDTGKVVIGQIPLVEKTRPETESLRHLEYLIISSLSVLDNTKRIKHIPPGIPIKRTIPEIDIIIKDLRKKLDYAEKLTNVCSRKSLKVVSDIDKDIESYRDLSSEPGYRGYRSLTRDLEKIKKNFDTNCVCLKKSSLKELSRYSSQ